MTSSIKSVLGFGKQTALGDTTVAAYDYMLYNQASFAPTNVVIPLDTEIGGPTPLIRDMVKTGVFGGGQVEFIPRPESIGRLLTGVLGKDAVTTLPGGGKKHTIDFNTDAFDIPYYTALHAPGSMWADKILDCRFTALGLNWKAANFVRGTLGVSGGMPAKVAAPGAVDPDDSAPFLTVLSSIELPTGTALKVLSGSFVAGNSIPLDEQWIVGAYSPAGFDVVSRAFAVQLVVKLTDGTLYNKMMYDPAEGASWTASLFKESNFTLQFLTGTKAGTDDVSMTIKGGSTDNVVWSADPVAVRAGRQVLMSMTGVFLATDTGSPVTVELVNSTATAY